jgi:chemotaxis signal transduction protein
MNDIAKPIENISSLITFQIGGERYCTDMESIVQIIDPSELNQEKDLNSEYSHINLGAVKIPMIDLHNIAGVKTKNISKDNRILVVSIDHNNFAIWVEKVNNIYTLSHDLDVEIEFNGDEEKLYLKGILNFKEQKMLLLDLGGLLLTNKNIN